MNTKDDKQERQVVSRQRVADHGEVYTAKREVNAMLDLVKEETERIDSRFLEPACGNGNFLVEILNRKMEAVRRQHSRNRFEYDQASAVAVSSMYGVELLPDNVEACRNRLMNQYLETYREHQHVDASDALTMLQNNGEPITFCEWTFIGTNGKVKRRDFELSELLRNVEYDKPKPGEEGLLFADTGEPTFVHLPKREYPIVDYLKLPDYE